MTKHCPNLIPKNMKVELEHWGDSEFNNWISKPCFIGKYHYFFGELELDINWFKRQFKKQVASTGDKFNPSLHTETLADTCIHALLGDELFASQIYKWIEKLNEELEDLKKYIETLKGSVPDTIRWPEKEKLKIVDAAESLQKQIISTAHLFEKIRKLLQERNFHEVKAIDWKAVRKRLDDAVDNYFEVANESGVSKIEYTGV